MREHIQTPWIFDLRLHPLLFPSHQQGVWFMNRHKEFERCSTHESCRGTCYTMREGPHSVWTRTSDVYTVLYQSCTVFIVFQEGKRNTLSLIHGDRTQEESLVPTGMNDACEAWLGCISGVHCRDTIPQMIYFNIYKRNISCCLEQNPHSIHVHFLHVCVFSMCMCVLYVHLVRVCMHVITFHAFLSHPGSGIIHSWGGS